MIVGPNGSGKSNLVDAISWALGEQGARALRGGQMADVIFAGTPSRPALGMAEVKLVIDNEAGKIPVPMTEIEISRTIFRSGESEYRIGGQVVRFSTSRSCCRRRGSGARCTPSSARDSSRRCCWRAPRSAAATSRRPRASRSTAAARSAPSASSPVLDQDLLRLADVLTELRRQLKPLKQQAESAKKHESLTAEADALAGKLAAARLRALLRERERRKGGWDQGLEQRRSAREQLDALDTEVLAGADARAEATTALADAERAFRATAEDRERAEQTYRTAVDEEAAARQALAGEAGIAARMDAVIAELERVEEAAQTVVADLERSESELDAAEAAHRQAEDDRHRVEEERRRIGEEAASRRAEADAVRGTLASAEHEHQRLGGALDAIRARVETAEAARGEIEADIEHLDGQTAPLAERRRQLDDERRALVGPDRAADRGAGADAGPQDLLDARRRDIEETPGSRFLAEHGGRAVGLLKDLVRIEDGLKRALVAALGPLADAVVYDDGALALADAPNGDGAILAIAAGGPVPVGLPGERQLLAAVDAEPAVRGIVSTVLRDVYFAATVDDAARKQAAHPDASFVTPEGVLVGPAVIHTAREADVRLREIRAELQVLAHDLSATDQQLRPRTERLEEIGGEVTFLQEQIEAADAEITDAAGRSTAAEHELVAMRTEADLLAQRFAAVTEAATAARDRLAAMGPTAGVAIPTCRRSRRRRSSCA